MSFSSVYHSLVCQVCRHIVPPEHIELQCRLSEEPGQLLRVGDEIVLRKDLESGGYIMMNSWEWPEKLYTLEQWTCPNNHPASSQWAILVVENLILRDVQSVTLTRPVLDKIHAVTLLALYRFSNEIDLNKIVQLSSNNFKAALLQAEEKYISEQKQEWNS